MDRLFVAVLMMVSLTSGSAYGQEGKSVAVFDEPYFPYYGTYTGLVPADVAAYLSRVGLPARLVDADKLADTATLNPEQFFCLVHLYGNTFPLEAAENLRRFHQKGGAIVATGVPFCHPCRRRGAQGWRFAAAGGDVVDRLDKEARTGRFCVRLSKSSKEWAGVISDRICGQPGAKYRVSGWVRTEGNLGKENTDKLYLRFWDEDEQFITQDGPNFPPGSGEWRFISKEVEAPARTLKLDIYAAVRAHPGALWMDDLSLALTNAPEQNLLANPGFEMSGGEWEDLGHESKWQRHDHIGTGAGRTLELPGPLVYHPDLDCLQLNLFNWPRWVSLWKSNLVRSQALNPSSLPQEDTVTSILDCKDAQGTWPILGVIQHQCRDFPGALDIWLGGQLFASPPFGAPRDLRELVARAACYIARKKGVISEKEWGDILERSASAYAADSAPHDLVPVKEAKPFPGLFPRSPKPAEELVVLDVRHLSLEKQILLASVQGQVNRPSPRLYLILEKSPVKPQIDERWLDWMQRRGDVVKVRRIDNWMKVLDLYRKEFEGLVIFDPDLPASINVATMVASLQGGIVASPGLAARLGLHVIDDLRGRWRTNAKAYAWAFQHLWPRMNHHVLAISSPDWPELIDYAIAHRIFTIWLTGPVDGRPPTASPFEERRVMEQVLAASPPNIGVIGTPHKAKWVGLQESAGVSLLSQYAKFLAWSRGIPNLSVHSGTRPGTFRQRAVQCPPLKGDKVYLALLISDGDAPINWYRYYAPHYWDDPAHGELPLTWTVGPGIADLMPDVTDFYYSQAGENDYFVCAVSGAGYCYPDNFAHRYARPEDVYEGFLRLTHESMETLDLHAIWTHMASGDRLQAFAQRVPGLACLLPDYGRRRAISADNANLILPPGVPAFHALTTYDPHAPQQVVMNKMLKEIREFTPSRRPAFMHVFVLCYRWTPTRLKDMMQNLGPDYVAVRADHLAQLYRQARSHAPGNQ